MKTVKKILLRIAQIALTVYIVICGVLFFIQESIIFAPSKLDAQHTFIFHNADYEEFFIKASDEAELNALLFKADSSKGLIFYLHGNAGSLKSWGNVAQTYTSRGYDVFLLDYRGYGKSEGEISSESQFYDDVQRAYDFAKKKYTENKITVLGYSIGTGPAAMIAANNKPRKLILQAPYYSLTDMMRQHYSFAPTFLLKYSFNIASFLPKVKAPITIFHGTNDAVIYYGSSIKLKELFKKEDQLITLINGRHNGMSNHPDYLASLDAVLE